MLIHRPFIAALILTFTAALAQAEGISVSGPFLYSSRANAPTAAGYMVIFNDTDRADVLLDVRSEIAARTTLHRSEMSGEGMSSMHHMNEGFEIGAGEELLFSQGGNHVMFMGLKGPLIEAQNISLTLVFEQAGEIVIEMPIELTHMFEVQTSTD